MKRKILNQLLIGVILMVSPASIAQTSNKTANDSIQYELKLSKPIFSGKEPIIITIVTKNISNTEIRKRIDGGNHPIGAMLRLKNSKGESMIENYRRTSQTYSIEETEKMKTSISPNGEYSKNYNLMGIVALKKTFIKGKYELSYGNSKPIKFQLDSDYEWSFPPPKLIKLQLN